MARPSEFQNGLNEGIQQGKKEMMKQVLDWLEEQYLNPKVKRGSERGQAILEVAHELSRAVREGGL